MLRVTRWLSAVGIALLITLAVAAEGARWTQGGIGLSLQGSQEGSPVSLTAARHDNGVAFGTITVTNISPKTVSRITFGALVFRRDAPSATPMYIEGGALPARLRSGETKTIETNLIDQARAREISRQFSDGADIEAGVVAVEFDDRTRWSFDAKGRARFGRTDSSRGAACSQWRWPFSVVAYAFQGDPYYTCTQSDNDEWCENKNQGASCENHICSGTPCPKQKCQLIVP